MLKNISTKSELYLLSIKPHVYLFTPKEAGDASNTSNGNSFGPHSGESGSGKPWVPVSAVVPKLYLNVGNGFSLLSQYPYQSGHIRIFVAGNFCCLILSSLW